MSARIKDFTGQQFGKLTVIKWAGWYTTPSTGGHLSVWLCQCECGKQVNVRGSHLRDGNTISCGCYRDKRPFKDLTGLEFGWLKVLRHVGFNNGRNTIWRCLCICGKEVEISGRGLVHGRSASCGCAKANEAPRSVLIRYKKCKAVAQNRSLCFELTIDDVARLTNAICHYCGCIPGAHNGIDRLDSSTGYTPSNCVPCCWICNRAKGGDLTPEQFREWIRQAYLHGEYQCSQ